MCFWFDGNYTGTRYHTTVDVNLFPAKDNDVASSSANQKTDSIDWYASGN